MAFANHRCLYIVLSWILSSLEHEYCHQALGLSSLRLSSSLGLSLPSSSNIDVIFGLSSTSACCLGYICGLFYRVFCLTILKTHFKALLTRLIAFCVYWPMFDNKIDCRPVSGHLNGISLSLFEIHSRLVLFLLSGHLNRDTHLNMGLRMSKNSSFITQLSSFEFALVYSARPQRSFGYEHRHSGRGVGLLWRIGLGLLSQQERSDCVYMGAVSAAPKP